MKWWAAVDQYKIQQCDKWLSGWPSEHKKCVQESGADQTMFQQQGTTPVRYWSDTLGFYFMADLILTALLVGVFFVVRWVVRGFKAEA